MESMKLGKELVRGVLGEAEEVDQDVRMDIVDDHVGGNMVLVLLCNNLKLDRCECEVEVVEAAVIQKKTEGDSQDLDTCESGVVVEVDREEVEVDWVRTGMKGQMAAIQGPEGEAEKEVG